MYCGVCSAKWFKGTAPKNTRIKVHSRPQITYCELHLFFMVLCFFCKIAVFIGIFCDLFQRREKRKKESLLWEELVQSVQFLNQFMETENKIRYVAFDMARSNKKWEILVEPLFDFIPFYHCLIWGVFFHCWNLLGKVVGPVHTNMCNYSMWLTGWFNNKTLFYVFLAINSLLQFQDPQYSLYPNRICSQSEQVTFSYGCCLHCLAMTQNLFLQSTCTVSVCV